MGKPKKIKPVEDKELTEAELMKYEIAEELGLMDKVKKTGWKSLTAKESGKIGGMMNKRKKAQQLLGDVEKDS